MGDRGYQFGVTALGTAAGLGVTQRDDDAADETLLGDVPTPRPADDERAAS